MKQTNKITCFSLLIVALTLLSFALATVVDPTWVSDNADLTIAFSFVFAVFGTCAYSIADEPVVEGHTILPSNI